MPVSICVAPGSNPSVERAVEEGGGRLAPLAEADGLVWLDHRPSELPELPARVRWVQFSSAGIDHWLRAGRITGDRAYTSAAGAYALPVAEHALALMLAGDRGLAGYARARTWDGDGRSRVRALEGSTVAVVGAGGIGRALISMLAPFAVRTLAVTRRGRPVPGADDTVPADRLDDVWPAAHHVVVAAPATAGTRHLVGERELAAMREDAWLVNVARGSLVDTDALVEALRAGAIAGAGLDVTDPEPLPDGHPLWDAPNVLITPHVATPPAAEARHFAERVRENVRRFAAGEPLLAPIDADAGY